MYIKKIIMDNQKQLNITFDPVLSDIKKQANVYELYIINANETTTNKNMELHAKLANQIAKLKQAQLDIDTYDTSKRYTKCLLKNLVELSKHHKNVSYNNKIILTKIKKDVKKFVEYIKFQVRLFVALTVMITSMLYYTNIVNVYSVVVTSTVLVITGFYGEQFNIVHESVDDEINKIRLADINIKKIDDSQDFLNDYIENI